MDFANPDDLLNFKLIIMPDEVKHVTLLQHNHYYVNINRVFIEMDDLYSTFK